MDGPELWFTNRGSGFVVLLLLTVTAVLGVLATRGSAGQGVPRFLTQALHRNLSLLAMALLGVHVTTAVVDEYVDIRWWHALVPFGASYKPMWLELGTAALDILVLVVLTSLLRHRLPHRGWRALHLSAYAAWAVALVHGLEIGTDAQTTWGRSTTFACLGAVALAALARLAGVLAAGVRRRRAPEVPMAPLPAGVPE